MMIGRTDAVRNTESTNPTVLGAHEDGSYCLLTTFRRNGEGVATPLWFATENATIYVRTGVQSGKVKRIAVNPRVEVAPCTLRGRPLGPAARATARVVTDADEEKRAEHALSSKYGVSRPLVMRFLHWRGVEELYLAIEPAADAPPDARRSS